MRAARVATAFVAVLLLTVGAACSSDDKKDATSSMDHNMTPLPQPVSNESSEAFARFDPNSFAVRMQDKDAVLINVHIPYEGELEDTDAFIPYNKILDDPKLPKDKDTQILLYCRTGRMSEEAGRVLHDAGYTNLTHLEGGMKAWEASGRKLIQNPAHAA